MRQDRNFTTSADVFVSSKCSTGIPHAGGLVHDLLVQLTLDPAVLAIAHVGTVTVGASTVTVDAIMVERVDGRFVLDPEASRPLRSLAEQDRFESAMAKLCWPVRPVESVSIMREPLFSNCRAAWAYRRVVVPFSMRIALLHAFDEEGPALTLERLCTLVSGPIDPIGAVLSLACDNSLEVDLSQPFGPSSVLRLRP